VFTFFRSTIIDNPTDVTDTAPEPKVTEVRVVRLTPEQFSALRAALPPPALPRSDLEAAYLLGVQQVLEVIRKGWSLDGL
jgi:hypothetical protein